ncbi:MAG: four helix bundle protein [Phycisphaerae bacterium]
MDDGEKKNDIRTYRDLLVWQKAMDVAERVYQATGAFEDGERYGLVAQMRRAAVSVASNVAEGFGRGHRAEFRRYLEIARGSLFELQTQAELARRLGWLKGTVLTEMREGTQEVDRLRSGLMRSVKRRPD